MNVMSDTHFEPVVDHVVIGASAHKPDPHATRFGKFLQATIRSNASDLILKSDAAPRVRVKGSLKTLDTDPVEAEEFVQIAKTILTEEQWQDLGKWGSVDFAYEYDEVHRFRVNMFQSKGKLSAAARLITSKILPFEELHLPPVMAEISMQPQGIVLITGVTGSGKSTTIASMLDYVNERKNVHIVTIEDPIEFVFRDKKATVHQREVGIDVKDFKTGLRALVRENPDIVLIGEMRDAETVEAAMHAAQTGHLVFGTVHASSTSQTLTRILDLFPPEEREQVRKIMAEQTRAIVYQKLLPTLRPDIYRIPALEILINNSIVKKFILEERESELLEVLRNPESQQSGMIDYNGSLVKLVEEEYIQMRVAMESTTNPDELKMRLKNLG